MCCLGSGRYSLLTVNIYLNDLTEEEAGRTRFYTDAEMVRPATPTGYEAPCIPSKTLTPYLSVCKYTVRHVRS